VHVLLERELSSVGLLSLLTNSEVAEEKVRKYDKEDISTALTNGVKTWKTIER
jgi:hypothetical protein